MVRGAPARAVTVAGQTARLSYGPIVKELPYSLYLDDFVLNAGDPAGDPVEVQAEVVFVGYGIQAPEEDWDDFKGADVSGKVLLMLNDDPHWDPELFAGERKLYYGRWRYKYESAARQGAG